MKFNVWTIIRDHFGTLYNNRTKKLSWSDVGAFVGVPVVAGLVIFALEPAVMDLNPVLTAVAVLAGFLFAALLLVLEVGLRLGDEARDGTAVRTRMAILKEVRTNVAYASLVAIASTAIFGLGNLTADGQTPLPVWYVSAGVILLLHLLLTLVMVVKRLYLLLGTEADERPHRNVA